MARRLKVAVAQLGPVHRADDRSGVVKRLIAMMREAHGARARLVVFPELALTTFFPRYWFEDEAEVDAWFERAMPSATVQPLFDEARRLSVGFYLGYAELAHEDNAKRRYNTSVLVGPDGLLVGKYRKVHLPGHADHRPQAPFQHLEKRYFESGNLGFPVWRAFGANIGMCICNDRRWPETFRVMGLQAVERGALGYNTPTDNIYHAEPLHLRMFHNHLVMQAGAYQNATWVAAAAKAGREDGFGLMGGSCIIAPTGEMVALAASEADEVITYDCDLDLGENMRRNVFDFARHRRIEHYRLITERVGAVPPGNGVTGRSGS